MKKLIGDGTSVKAKLWTYGSCLCCSLFLVFCSAPESSHDGPDSAEMFNTELSATNKPWTRWWWHGSSVTREGITAELEAYANAGIGGVELTPIYGVRGDEAHFVEFLSPEWVDLLEHTLQEAGRLGMQVDMATGTGWPFGGPWVGEEDASRYFEYRMYELAEGESLAESIALTASPILRTVRPSETRIENLRQPVSANEDLQALAIDQVRFPNPLPLQAVVAYGEDARIEDLTGLVNEEGKLDWIAPEGSWQVYAVFMGWHGKMVERAAPGGEGNVIDHFSRAAIENYLARFDRAFAGRKLDALRAFFNDSYEVDDAQGQADWTPDLFSEFESRRGYDLRDFLPALVGNDTEEANERVLTDYRESISDLLLEKFTRTWVDWAHSRGALVRNQAHGSPANILDLYAACDIPETEGTDLIKIKMASSAAHLAGRQLASAEAATWLGEHFVTNLANLKENIDRYFVGGINHVVYHGTCYSPSGMAWPGRLFYAAIHANPRNPLWHDYPAFNRYVGRVQSLLQRSQQDNSILLYFPIYDRYADRGQEMLEHFDGSLENNGPTKVRTIAELLLDRGYAFDFVSDRQLTMSGFSDEDKADHLSGYRTIIIPATTFIPLNTVQTLAALADQGMNIIFEEMPKHVPGLHEAEAREEELDSILGELVEHGKVTLAADIDLALSRVGESREEMVDVGLEFIRKKHEVGHTYFLSNWTDTDFDGNVSLTATGPFMAIYDPMTDMAGLAETMVDKGKLSTRIQVKSGGSLILYTLSQRSSLKSWIYDEENGPAVELNGLWQLAFIKGGPVLPDSTEISTPRFWTDLSGDPYQDFSGTARYRLSFERPDGAASRWRLDLGQVRESASLILNNQPIGICVGPQYQVVIDDQLLAGQNILDIEVSNSMANRIISLEKEGVHWKTFYNINFPARLRENLGDDRLFTARHWSPFPSGMAGPVTLTPLK